MIQSALKKKHLFWDVDLDKLDNERDKQFIISRVLEFGDIPDFQQLFIRYTRLEITEAITHSRSISKPTASLWKNVLDITEPILCLQDSSPNRLSKLWKR